VFKPISPLVHLTLKQCIRDLFFYRSLGLGLPYYLRLVIQQLLDIGLLVIDPADFVSFTDQNSLHSTRNNQQVGEAVEDETGAN